MEYLDYLTKEINRVLFILKRKPPNKSKYSTRDYLKIFIDLVETSLALRKYCRISTSCPHYSTISKKFTSWSKLGVFEFLHEKISLKGCSRR